MPNGTIYERGGCPFRFGGGVLFALVLHFCVDMFVVCNVVIKIESRTLKNNLL